MLDRREAMEARPKLGATAALLLACAATASAQIITVPMSAPSTTGGSKRDKFSFHIMETPLAKWDYKEVYIDISQTNVNRLVSGVISGQPNSNFMVAGEMAFALGEGNWSMTLGGWHNAIGQNDFALDALFGVASLGTFPCTSGALATGFCGPLVAKVPLKLTMYEAHVGFFYKALGVQVGFVRTQQGLGQSLVDAKWTVKLHPSDPFPTTIPLGELPVEVPGPVPEFHTTTNDLTLFAVYRRSERRWGLSLGAGAYLKEGIASGSPLRFANDETVPSAFVAGSLNMYKGLGLDLSYWFVGKTRSIEPFVEATDIKTRTDSQSRFTLGLGFSF